MMNCTTLKNLEDHFICKLENLSTCMDLVSLAQDPGSGGTECKDQLASINEDLCTMESILVDLRRTIQRKKNELTAAKDMKDALDELIKDSKHMKDNLPHHLDQARKQAEPIERQPLQERHIEENTYILPQLPKPKKAFPRIVFITSDEFKSVPKYMKGRLTYEQINSMVEVINETIRKKYQLMTMPKNQISAKQMKLYTKYKEQINKDTKGAYFFAAEDLTKYCSLKTDSSVRSRLTILRHCARLREVRGGGLTRYVIIQ